MESGVSEGASPQPQRVGSTRSVFEAGEVATLPDSSLLDRKNSSNQVSLPLVEGANTSVQQSHHFNFPSGDPDLDPGLKLNSDTQPNAAREPEPEPEPGPESEQKQKQKQKHKQPMRYTSSYTKLPADNVPIRYFKPKIKPRKCSKKKDSKEKKGEVSSQESPGEGRRDPPSAVFFQVQDPARDQCAMFDFCEICQSFRPPRASHCAVCERCTLRRDHHCTWLNNCIGFYNVKYFILYTLHYSILLLLAISDVLFLLLPLRLYYFRLPSVRFVHPCI